jgi:hypothetical protein
MMAMTIAPMAITKYCNARADPPKTAAEDIISGNSHFD